MDADGTTPRRGWRLLLCLTAAVAALGVAACGDDDEESAGGGGTTAPAETTPSDSGTSTNAGAEPITDFQEYVGGKAGKASGEAIPVGWINNDSAAQGPIPEATRVAKATVDLINNELGGIDGRPIKLETCFIGAAEEEGQKCGQRFVNDSAMKVVNVGVMIVGNESYHAQIKGEKVTVFGVANSPADLGAREHLRAERLDRVRPRPVRDLPA